jgi:sortase A
MPRCSPRATVAVGLLVGFATTSCAAGPERDGRAAPPGPHRSSSDADTAGPATAPTSPATAAPDRGPRPGDGRPAAARLSIPALGMTDLRVVPYRGRTDDAAGTRIQNDGRLASPHGPQGGVGPGGIGNYQVTGHRLSSTQPFRYLPRLEAGERVVVESGGRRYVYRVVRTRETSFRSPRSLREQRAAVPGRPGVAPTRAMITLSTCATIEDHREGNYWSDRFGNPEHRIDKIGVLARSSPS